MSRLWVLILLLVRRAMSSRLLLIAPLWGSCAHADRISAMSSEDVITYRDMSAKDKIFGSVVGVAWLGLGAYVWQVAAPTYSDATKAKIILFWLACGVALLLWWM